MLQEEVLWEKEFLKHIVLTKFKQLDEETVLVSVNAYRYADCGRFHLVVQCREGNAVGVMIICIVKV